MPLYLSVHRHLDVHTLRHLFLFLHRYRFYEYLIVFLGTVFEGEIVLLTAGFLAFNGAVDVYAVIIIGFIGAITGDNVWYAVGRYGGIKFINRYGKFLLLTKSRVDRAREYFTKHGGKTVFLSRFIFGTRIGSAALAGTFGMGRKRFISTNAIGALTWVVITVSLGYFFGSSFHNLRRAVHNTEIALLILAAIAFIIAIIRLVVTQIEQ